ncbi:hypothetical protein DFH09DRAFT_1097066 [Mycena vulgaris]|nr:hypothetical protein DFH09DRAFT_1097066 [Mycena vulgaris]
MRIARPATAFAYPPPTPTPLFRPTRRQCPDHARAHPSPVSPLKHKPTYQRLLLPSTLPHIPSQLRTPESRVGTSSPRPAARQIQPALDADSERASTQISLRAPRASVLTAGLLLLNRAPGIADVCSRLNEFKPAWTIRASAVGSRIQAVGADLELAQERIRDPGRVRGRLRRLEASNRQAHERSRRNEKRSSSPEAGVELTTSAGGADSERRARGRVRDTGVGDSKAGDAAMERGCMSSVLRTVHLSHEMIRKPVGVRIWSIFVLPLLATGLRSSPGSAAYPSSEGVPCSASVLLSSPRARGVLTASVAENSHLFGHPDGVDPGQL